MKSAYYLIPMGVFLLLWSTTSFAKEDKALVIYINSKNKAANKNSKKDTQTTAIINTEKDNTIKSTRVEDIADYVGGITLGRNQAGIGSDVYLRGYSLNGNFQLNGLQDIQGFYLRSPDTLEQINFYKGLDSIQFGSGSPGGMVEYQTKKAKFTNERKFNITVGSPKQVSTTLDINKIIKPELAVRLVVSGQKAQTGRKNVEDDRITVLPSLLWKTANHSLAAEYEYGWQNRPYDFDTIFYQGKPIYNVSYVDPRSYADREMQRFMLSHEYQINPNWKTRLKTNYARAKRDERWIGFAYLPSDKAKVLPGYYRDAQYKQSQYAIRSELEGNYELFGKRQHTNLGYSTQRVNIDVDRKYRTGLFNLDIFDPKFDFDLPTDKQLTHRQALNVRDEQAFYLQQNTALNEKVDVKWGVRQSRFYGKSYTPITSFQDSKNKNTAISVGGTWQVNKNLQAFAGRQHSFQPNLGSDTSGNFFKPMEAVQYEAGIRYQKDTRLNKPVLVNASVYQIKQENVTNADLANPGYLILTGKTQSEGVDISTELPLSKKTYLKTSYNYNKANITENNSGNKGNELHNTPKHQASLQLKYQKNPRFHATLGLVHVGKRMGDDANSFKVPAYNRIDAGLGWQFNPKTKLTLSARNLLNKDYVAATQGVDFIVQGQKRVVNLGFDIEF